MNVQNNLAHPLTVFWGALGLAWAALMFCLTGQPPHFSQTLLARMLHFLHRRVSAGTFRFLHAVLRKLAHLSEYAIFGLLLYGVSGEQRQFAGPPRRAMICILVVAG